MRRGKKCELRGGSEMVEKKNNKDLYSMWYNLSNEMGKKLIDIPTLGDLNYGALQDSWKGYSERMSEQMDKLLNTDDSYYKEIVTLWNEFTEHMNTQVTNLNLYDKNNFSKWYETWLEYYDKMNKEFSSAIQYQLKQHSELHEMNELWLNKFNFNDDYKQQILEITRILSEYCQETINKANEIVKRSFEPENNNDLYNNYHDFYKFWTESYLNMTKQLITASNLDAWKDYGSEFDFIGYKMMQKYFNNNLKSFGIADNYEHDKYNEEFQALKKDVETLSKELGIYKKQSNTYKKK